MVLVIILYINSHYFIMHQLLIFSNRVVEIIFTKNSISRVDPFSLPRRSIKDALNPRLEALKGRLGKVKEKVELIFFSFLLQSQLLGADPTFMTP